MSIYERFAYFYAKGQYPQYSERMVELLPTVLERFGAKPQIILDLACGEGTFALAMAKKGFLVTGVDLSPNMLQFARERAQRVDVKVEFLLQDIRFLPCEERFDLVTCWYDSLNYRLELEDLEKTFAGVWRALKKGGLFIFDMNTIYGLAINWQRYPCYVQQDTPELSEDTPEEKILSLINRCTISRSSFYCWLQPFRIGSNSRAPLQTAPVPAELRSRTQ